MEAGNATSELNIKMARLTHLDRRGEASMVDVSSKPVVLREAVAQGHIRLLPETLRLIESNGIAKGNVLATARLAGIMAAKKTGELIPLCHPCLLYTSDAADERSSVDLGGRR